MKADYLTLLQEFGLSPNESGIYESLVKYGELNVADISTKAKIHRRNVYDALQRLLEKGLVYEVLEHKTSFYQAVSPEKLLDIINEKRDQLLTALPDLMKLYQTTSAPESVHIYRGVEGLKNYMRDILRVGADYYSIGAKGVWADPRVAGILPSFLKEAKKKKITFHVLYDPQVRDAGSHVLNLLPTEHRYLPEFCKTPASLGVFGNTTVVLTNTGIGKMAGDISFTVITNQHLAESIRLWFKVLWEMSSSIKDRKTPKMKK